MIIPRGFVVALLLAGACPALASEAAPSGTATGEAKRAVHFVGPADVDLTTLLPPPPASESAQTKAELGMLQALEKDRTPARQKIAVEDFAENVFEVIRSDLGPNFRKENLPAAAAFFERLLADEGAVVDPAKKAWARPRPGVLDPTLHTCMPPQTSASYPSGHGTVGYLTAIVLSDMIPERRADVFASAARFAESRLVCGFHYPSDIEASKTTAALMAAQARTNPAFRSEFESARAEVRKALGLAPLPGTP